MYAVPVSPIPPADLRDGGTVRAPSEKERKEIKKPPVNLMAGGLFVLTVAMGVGIYAATMGMWLPKL